MTFRSKICGRCKTNFQCNADDIEKCACTQVKLSSHTISFMRETYYNCLCNNCLIALNNLIGKSKTTTLQLTENIHFYIENGNYIFTELYHIQRGNCCGNNCRHCAYGYQQNKK